MKKSLFPDCHHRVEDVVQRYDADKVGEAYQNDDCRKSLDEAFAPADEIVRCDERADDIAYSVQQSEHVGDLPVEHEHSERERRSDKYHESFDDVRRNDVHAHRPKRYGEYQIAYSYINIAAVEAYQQKPQIVARLDVDIMPLLDFEPVVENDINENYDQNYAETYFEYRFIDMRRHERAGYVADNDGYRQQQPVPYVEHPFREESRRRREILQQNGYAVGSVGDGYRQPECGEHGHGDNRASAGESVDYADYDTRYDKRYDYVPIHAITDLLLQI